MGPTQRAQFHDPIRAVHLGLAVLCVALGVWLRYRGALGELWLDEIWSLNFATTHMNVWHEAFWKIIHDNNHPLNTLWLFLAGPDKAAWFLRLPAIVAGGLSIAVAGWIMDKNGAAPMLSAMLLMAVLYPLVHFGSEARGYGLMILFLLIAFGAVERARDNPAAMKWLFAVAVTLGTWSHLSILPIAFFLAVAYAYTHWRDHGGFWSAIQATLSFCTPVTAGLSVVLAGIYAGYKDQMFDWYGGRATDCPEIGCFSAALDELIGYTLGGITTVPPGLLAGLSVILIAGAVVWLSVLRHPRAALYAFAFFGVSGLYIALGQPNVPYGRYFIGLFALVPLLLADVIGAMRQQGRLCHRMGIGVLLVLVGVSLWTTVPFSRDGRGHYRAAFDLIAREATAQPQAIGTDMVFRTQTLFSHAAMRKGLDFKATYIPAPSIATAKPDWFVGILPQKNGMPSGRCFRNDNGRVAYGLVQVFKYWGVAGIDIGVYKRLSVLEARC